MSDLRVHRLKTWPAYWHEVMQENKKIEIRRADRDFRVGDFLQLDEFDPQNDKYTGRKLYRFVSHILTSNDAPRALIDGFVALSLDELSTGHEEVLDGRDSIIWQRREIKP